MFIFVVYKLYKVNQISKMVVATYFQRLFGVIKYADFEYDIFNNIICLYLLFTSYIK